MKRKKIIILSIVAAIIVAGSFMIYKVISDTNKNLDVLNQTEIQNIDLSEVADGEYSGRYSVFPVTVEVMVTTEDHKIKDIEILKHDCGKGKPAESIVDEVIKSNSLQVDAVSKATFSSKVILKAIEDALLSAETK